MTVMRCSKDGAKGYKWGDGVCFIGPDAKQRAFAVGRALAVQKSDSGTIQSEIEDHVSSMDTLQVLSALELMDPFGQPLDTPTKYPLVRKFVDSMEEGSVEMQTNLRLIEESPDQELRVV